MTDISCTIRTAAASDAPVILRFIRELAAYERLDDEVVATEQDLMRTLFGEQPAAEVMIADTDVGPDRKSVV